MSDSKRDIEDFKLVHLADFLARHRQKQSKPVRNKKASLELRRKVISAYKKVARKN
jgi:hypothetical protein